MEKSMSEILRELRTNKKMTQSDVAKLLGLTTNAYQSYERGTSEPSCKALKTLADFYGVTTDYLLGREPAPNPFANLNITVDNKKFIDIYQELPEYQQQLLVDAMLKLGASAQKGRAVIEEKQKTRHEVCTGDLIDDEQAEVTDAG